MSSYSDFANAASRIEEAKGNALAEGARQNGAIWGGALGNLGSLITQYPLQQAQIAEAKQRQQLTALQLSQAQRQQQASTILGQGLQDSINPDGSINVTKLTEAARQHPELASQWPDVLDRINKAAETTIALKTNRQKADQLEQDQVAEFVSAASVAKTPADQAAIFTRLLQHGIAAGTIDPEHGRDTLAQLLGPDGQPDPDAVQQTFRRALQLSSSAKAARAKLMEPTKLGPGDRLVIPGTGDELASAPPRITNESELLLAAADPNHPLHAQAVEAQRIKTQPTPDQVADNARQAAAQAETLRHNRAIEALSRARIAQSGDQTKEDAKAIADAIASGDQPPSVTGLYRFAGPVRAELARQGYDFTKANLDWEATKKHLATLNGAQQTRLRQAISTASDSLGVIEDLAKQWDGGKFPILNKATLAAAKNGAMGPKAQQIATNLTAQITDVTSELGNVYMGGNSPTDHALSLAQQNLNANWTRDQLLSAIKLARTNLQIRQNSIANSGAITTGGAQGGGNAADPLGILK